MLRYVVLDRRLPHRGLSLTQASLMYCNMKLVIAHKVNRLALLEGDVLRLSKPGIIRLRERFADLYQHHPVRADIC